MKRKIVTSILAIILLGQSVPLNFALIGGQDWVRPHYIERHIPLEIRSLTGHAKGELSLPQLGYDLFGPSQNGFLRPRAADERNRVPPRATSPTFDAVPWERLPDWPSNESKGIKLPRWTQFGIEMNTYLGRFDFEQALEAIRSSGERYPYVELADEPTVENIRRLYGVSRHVLNEETSLLYIEGKWFLVWGNSGRAEPKYSFDEIPMYAHVHNRPDKLDRYPSRNDLKRAEWANGFHFIVTEQGISAYSRKEYIPLFVPFAKLDPSMTISQLYASLPAIFPPIASSKKSQDAVDLGTISKPDLGALLVPREVEQCI